MPFDQCCDWETAAAAVDVVFVVPEDAGKSWRYERTAIVAYWHRSVAWEGLAGTFLWSVVIGAVFLDAIGTDLVPFVISPLGSGHGD